MARRACILPPPLPVRVAIHAALATGVVRALDAATRLLHALLVRLRSATGALRARDEAAPPLVEGERISALVARLLAVQAARRAVPGSDRPTAVEGPRR